MEKTNFAAYNEATSLRGRRIDKKLEYQDNLDRAEAERRFSLMKRKFEELL